MLDKSFTKWTKEDADTFVDAMKKSGLKTKTIYSKILCIRKFIKYLLLNELSESDPFIVYMEYKPEKYEFKATAKDEYVIMQIFNVLDKFKDLSLVICFLCIYCTGMRVSEACLLRKDCLEKQNNNYFIFYYQIKMKKTVFNVIPKALYNLILDYRKGISNNTEYLFPGKIISQPRQSSSFSEMFKKELNEFNILNNDGTKYNFTPHSFRHLMAVKMREENIPFQFIQEQLHHESPEMTVAYIEFLDRQKITKMKNFINIHGKSINVENDIKPANDIDYAEYIRKYINAQILPNGLCARPVKLGKCPHCNACLSCEDFRTSKEFLSVHEKQVINLDKYISIAKENGWEIQAAESERTKKQLEIIINALKKDINNE